MEEIYYIARIDARPWKKTQEVGAVIPLVLFFASIESLKKAWNLAPSGVPEIQKYFVIISLVVLGIYLSRYIPRWPETYSKRFILNLIYLTLISAGLYSALTQIPFINTWLVVVHNKVMEFVESDAEVSILYSAVIVSVGTFYIWLCTSFHLRAEARTFLNKHMAQTFLSFRKREYRCLRWIYLLYFIGGVSLISFLTATAPRATGNALAVVPLLH